MNRKIAVLGANPAWQKTLSFKKFSCGKVNRAYQLDEFASGKGVNFCRASIVYGSAEPYLLQFAGGENGKRLVDMLDKLAICHLTSFTATPTRCCTTILNESDNSTTECIEPSYTVSESETANLLEMAEKIMPECCFAAVCGTLPGETDKMVYREFASIAAKNSVPLLLDACKGVDDVFTTGCGIHLKINREELFSMTGKENVEEAFAKLFSTYPAILSAAVTDGPEQAFASDGKKLVKYQLPKLDNIVSTLGCGDTASAVYSGALADGLDFEPAFKKALAAASANCLSHLCGSFNTADADKIESSITVSREKIQWAK